ncbi:MAG: putative lipid II flippase FtsW [Parachlamydiaceae bacterium]|nr:putative lipid II flippase FtsW [Parachlamydiaceae bacterium]
MTLHRILLLICVSLIFAIGLVMIFSTTSAEVLDHDLDRSTHHALMRQLYYAVAGFALALGVGKMGYRNLLAYSPVILAIFAVLLVLTLIPGVGREVNGSRRWLGIAGFSFQPSEFVKYLVPAYFIHRLLEYRNKPLPLRDFLKMVGIVIVPLLLIMVEPNNGTAAVIGMTLTVVCLLMHVPVKYWAVPLCVFGLVGGVFASQLPYVTARLRVYMHPELDLKGKGHQPYQAKIAAGSGQLFGKGPGNSWQKLSYLPEAQNDYIAAIYAEEFGFIGILTLIALYMMLGYCGFAIASQTTDPAALYLGGAVTFLICFQAFLNLGVVSGLLPSTGLNLPLFSQGGTSLIANMMGIGILHEVAKGTPSP